MRWTPSLSSALAAAALAASAPAARAVAVYDCGGYTCFHDVRYGPRRDLPDEGPGFKGPHGGWTARDMPVKTCTHRSGQQFDLYVPSGAPDDAPLLFFIHCGAWSEFFDKGYVPPDILDCCMERGWLLCAPDFILQTDNTLNVAPGRRDEATFAEMLRDIDKAASRLDLFLRRAGRAPSKAAICGESSGAHLALLYAYDASDPSKLGLALEHPVRFSKAVSIAGPVDMAAMKDLMYRDVGKKLDTGARADAMALLVKRLLGLPDGAPDEEALEKLEFWQPGRLVSPSAPETILAYGRLLPFAPSDGLIPVAQGEAFAKKLAAAGVSHSLKVFPFSHHGNVSAHAADWVFERLAAE